MLLLYAVFFFVFLFVVYCNFFAPAYGLLCIFSITTLNFFFTVVQTFHLCQYSAFCLLLQLKNNHIITLSTVIIAKSWFSIPFSASLPISLWSNVKYLFPLCSSMYIFHIYVTDNSIQKFYTISCHIRIFLYDFSFVLILFGSGVLILITS